MTFTPYKSLTGRREVMAEGWCNGQGTGVVSATKREERNVSAPLDDRSKEYRQIRGRSL